MRASPARDRPIPRWTAHRSARLTAAHKVGALLIWLRAAQFVGIWASAAHHISALLIWLRAAQFVRAWPSAAHHVGTLLIWFGATHEVRTLTLWVCCHAGLLPAMPRSTTPQSLGLAGGLSDAHQADAAARRGSMKSAQPPCIIIRPPPRPRATSGPGSGSLAGA